MPFPWRNKRRAEEVEADERGYDGEESGDSIPDDKSADDEKQGEDDCAKGENIGGVEKKAAWLLMKLSVKDGERATDTQQVDTDHSADCGPRVKRRRAQSM